MFYRTDDPIADFMAYDAEQERLMDRLPKCDYCGEPITDDHLFDINGDVICESCLNENFRKRVEDYVE